MKLFRFVNMIVKNFFDKSCLRLPLLVLFFFQQNIGSGQHITPIDGEAINYKQIMFEVPKQQGANGYKFYFSSCDIRAEKCTLIYIHSSKFRATMLSQPFNFGKTYRWYYEALKGKNVLYTSKEFILNISKSELVDTLVQKVVFTKLSKKKEKGILIVDGLKLVLDMQGKPLLFLNYKYDHAIRDINLTNEGTLTLVDNRFGEVKECKLNGEMIWVGPTKLEESVGRSDKFHHEFEKLSNGNYLAAGKRKVTDFDETAGLIGVPDNTLCETIVEFDADRNEVWRFDLLPELKRQYNISPSIDLFNPTRLGHLNGMAVDEKKHLIYASFKTFNTVMKIDMGSNQILYQYGLKKINFLDSIETGLAFEQQHAPRFNAKGNLLIFNNGNAETGSGICELRVGDEVDSSNEVLKSFYFKEVLMKDYFSPQMGSVQAMGKSNYLICMGTVPHFFEFNAKSKKLLWQAYTFQNVRWEEGGKIWKPLPSYRINYYSSLYPYYFVADKLIEQKGELSTIELANCGTENDVYQLCASLSNEKAINTMKVILEFDCKSGKKIKVKYDAKSFSHGVILRSKMSKKELHF
ncbi:MAG: aryl-sulfate sulfotransferase [bacterium]|nr:aryl-sulfate sulfotransferase [bacterium]